MSEDKTDKPPKIAVVTGTGAASTRLIEEIGRAVGGASKPLRRDPDPIGRDPDIGGRLGRAWAVDLETFRRNEPNPDDATVAVWVIEALYAHPVWHSYMLTLVHLRPIPGSRSPKISRPGATHEFMLFALNPEEPRAPFVRGEGAPRYLTPANFGAQLGAPNDAVVLQAMERVVAEVCDGTLNPDTDFRAQWIARFGNHMIKPEYR